MNIKVNATSFVATTVILFIINIYLIFQLNVGYDMFTKLTTLENQVHNLNEMLIQADFMNDYMELYLETRESKYFEMYHQSAKSVYEFHTSTVENSTIQQADSLLLKIMDAYLMLYNDELDNVFGAGDSASVHEAWHFLQNNPERTKVQIEVDQMVTKAKEMYLDEINADKDLMKTYRDFYYQTYGWIILFNLLFFVIFVVNVYHIFLLAYKKTK